MNVRKSKITSSSKAGRLAVVPMVMYTRQFAKMGALLLLVYCSSYGSDVATLFLSNYNEINNNMRYLNAAFLMCISLMDHNIYDPEVSPELRYYPKFNTRGNKYKLLSHTFHYDTRKYCFSAHIVNIWTSLPNFVVDVDTVCLISSGCTKMLYFIYDFTADITGIGDRSVRESS